MGSEEVLGDHAELAEALVGPVPVIQAVVGGVPLACLWDTGSNVSVLTESFFQQHFSEMDEAALKACGWLSLKGAHGTPLPYVG